MKQITFKWIKTLAVCCSLFFFAINATDSFADPSSHSHTETHHTADSHGKKAGLPQLDPSSFPSQIFWLFVSFGLLYFIFTRPSLRNVTEIKTEREIRVEKDVQTTEELRTEAMQLKDEYETALTKAREDAKSAYQETHEKLQKQAQGEKQILQETLKEKIDNLSVEISDLKKQSKEEIEKIAEELTAQIVKKLSGQDVDKAVIRAMIKGVIEERKAA